MIDYASLKADAKRLGLRVADLLALAPANDPFYAGVGQRGRAAEWFAELWYRHGFEAGVHLRRIHYRLVSTRDDEPVVLPNGRGYANTLRDWSFLCSASLSARYLGKVPFDALVDRRNDEPLLYSQNMDLDRTAERCIGLTVDADPVDVCLEMPPLPGYCLEGLEPDSTLQDFIVEVWIEKSTQNDWLLPLCKRRGVNLVVGIGEQSEVRSRELALRSAEYGAPVRILYLSDFDPGGRSMPKAMARKVQFTLDRFDLDVDLQVIPVVLTPEQCREYDLPRTPIKDSETRKGKFEETFGIGATELDALEALYPGEMEKLVEAEIDNFLDRDLRLRMTKTNNRQAAQLRKIESDVESQFDDDLAVLRERFDAIVEQADAWESDASVLWERYAEALEDNAPDLSKINVPRPKVTGESARFVLFDSRRDYFTQLDAYTAWRDGRE